jgi:predicted AlkP superfamily phosphohydrolase/phosphomutase
MAILAALFCAGCGGEPDADAGAGPVQAETPPSPPVLCIGLDGLTWSVLHPMLEKGELPHLAGLMREGASGPLTSFHPISSPVIWSSIATGKSMAKHGITGFILKPADRITDTPDSKPVLVRNTRKCQALWNILSGLGRSVGVIGWWATWPVEEVRGYMISDRIYYDVSSDIYPQGYKKSLPAFETFRDPVMAQYVGTFPRPPLTARPSAALQQLERSLKVFEQIVKQDTYKWRVGRDLYTGEGPFDFFSVYIQGTDTVAHLFWKFMAPARFKTADSAEASAWADMIAGYYRYADRIVGDFISLSEGDTAVMVLSDHGLGPISEEFEYSLNPLLARLGYTVLMADGSADRTNSRLWDGSQKRTRERRIAYQSGLAEEERKSITAALTDALGAVSTPDGRPLIDRIEPGQGGGEITAVIGAAVGWRDLLVAGNARFPADEVIRPGFWSGDHILEGALFLAGPGVRKGYVLDDASVMDVTPTLLALMGLPVAKDMDGRVLRGLFTEEHWRKFPLKEIETYETGALPPRLETADAGEGDAALREKLEALGYLE